MKNTSLMWALITLIGFPLLAMLIVSLITAF